MKNLPRYDIDDHVGVTGNVAIAKNCHAFPIEPGFEGTIIGRMFLGDDLANLYRIIAGWYYQIDAFDAVFISEPSLVLLDGDESQSNVPDYALGKWIPKFTDTDLLPSPKKRKVMEST